MRKPKIEQIDYRKMDRSHETVEELYRFFNPSMEFYKRQEKLEYSNKTKTGIIDQLRTYPYMWDLEEYLGLKVNDFDNFMIAATFEQVKILYMLPDILGGVRTECHYSVHDNFLDKYQTRLDEIKKIAKPITGREFYDRHGLEKVTEVYINVFERTGLTFSDMFSDIESDYDLTVDVIGQTDNFKQRVFESVVGDSIEDVSIVLENFGITLEEALQLPWN